MKDQAKRVKVETGNIKGRVKVKRFDKPFICKRCRGQFGHDALVQNPAGTCPACGSALRSKEIDERETSNKVAKTGMGGH